MSKFRGSLHVDSDNYTHMPPMKIPVLFVFLIQALAAPVSGCWADIPLEKLLRSEPLIVAGTLGETKPMEAKEGERGMDSGTILIEKILKNSLGDLKLNAGDGVELVMPSSAPGTPRISVDIIYEPGKSGIWLLERRKDGRFQATYPKDYQRLENLQEMEALLHKAERSLMIDLSATIPKPESGLEKGAVIASLFEYDPFLADVAAKKVDEEVIEPFAIVKGITGHVVLTLEAPRTKGRKYYVTLFVHPDAKGGKRLYFADGFNKVGEKGNYEALELTLKPVGR